MRTLLVVCLMAMTGAVAWWGRGRLSSGSNAETGKTAVCRVMRGPMKQHVKARGIVKPAPDALVRIGFPTTKDMLRRISRLPVIEGDEITAGQELAHLDHEDLQATLRQLGAEAAVVERRLEALRLLEPLERRLADGVLAERKAQHTLARSQHQRFASLKKSTSLQEWEATVHDLGVASAKLAQAEASAEQVGVKFRTDIATLESQHKLAQAALENVRIQMSWCVLKSPFAGQVFAVHQRQGELSGNAPNAPVVTVLKANQLQVHLFIDEVDSGRIKKDQAVTLRVEARPEEVIKGHILRDLPQPLVQENVVYYLAVVEVDADQRWLLRAEMTVHGHIEIGTKESVLWLPQSALRSRPGGWHVVQRGSQGAIETPVRIGLRDQGRVEIHDGLVEGDEVLLEP